MMNIIIQTLGWIGTILFLAAYCLVTFKKIDPTSWGYQWLNLIGALCLGISVFYARAWPALALEVVWVGIAIVALTKKR